MILFLAQARLTVFFTVDLKKLKTLIFHLHIIHFCSQTRKPNIFYDFFCMFFLKWKFESRVSVSFLCSYNVAVCICAHIVQLINMSNFFLINDSSRLYIFHLNIWYSTVDILSFQINTNGTQFVLVCYLVVSSDLCVHGSIQ